MTSQLVVSVGTDSRTGKPVKCQGCQHNHQEQEEEYEEQPLMLTGVKLKRDTDNEEEDNEQKPLLPNFKY